MKRGTAEGCFAAGFPKRWKKPATVAELSKFLYKHFYRHEHLQRFREHARRLIFGLFDAYLAAPEELSGWYRRWAETQGLERAVCDFVAGMTDRFAEQEFRRLVGGPTISESLAE